MKQVIEKENPVGSFIAEQAQLTGYYTDFLVSDLIKRSRCQSSSTPFTRLHCSGLSGCC